MSINEDSIINIKIIPYQDEDGNVHDDLTVFGELVSGDHIPLFPFNEEKVSYDPTIFIGMSPENAKEEKRLLDLIYFGEVLD